MWAQLVNVAIGVWLMAAPSVFRYLGQPAEINDRVIGPLVAVFSCVAMWEVTRSLRWATFLLGLWMLPASLMMDHSFAGMINAAAAGVAIIFFSLVSGKQKRRYGGGWNVLWRRSINR